MKARSKAMDYIWFSVLVIGLIIVMQGCALLPVEEEALKPPLVKPAKQTFEVVDVKLGSISKELKNSASFVSSKSEDLFFKHSGGRLQSINKKLGERVEVGDVVAQLDPEDLENRIAQQILMLEKATIFYKQTEKQRPDDSVSLRLNKIDIEIVQNELTRLNEQLDKTKLISTIEGIVTYVSEAKEGDYMGAFITIISISDDKHIQLESRFGTGSELVNLKPGDDVAVTIKDKKYQGHILQSPNSVKFSEDKEQQDKNSKTLIIGVDGLPDTISMGDGADIIIKLAEKQNALIIPRSALSTFLGRDFVHVLEGESRKEIDVEKGIVSSTEIEIIKGLKEGQKVIIK